MDTHYFLKDAQGAYYPINGPTLIGRDPTCQIRLSDQEVSRAHALLWIERRNLYIRDENTRNGTYLNELRIPPNRPIALSVGSQLRLGNTFFTVLTLSPAAVQESAPIEAPVATLASQRLGTLPLLLIILIGVLCLGGLILAAGYLMLQLRSAPPMHQSFIEATILTIIQYRSGQK